MPKPLILRVPDVDAKRYYSVMLCDGNTYNYGYIGSRTTGNGAGVFLVAGPDWKGDAPVGIRQVFRSSTQFSLIIYRTQLFGPDDIDEVRKIQAGYTTFPLPSLPGQEPVKAAPGIEFPYIDKDTVRLNFFEYLDFALQFAPERPNEGRYALNWRVLVLVPASALSSPTSRRLIAWRLRSACETASRRWTGFWRTLAPK